MTTERRSPASTRVHYVSSECKEEKNDGAEHPTTPEEHAAYFLLAGEVTHVPDHVGNGESSAHSSLEILMFLFDSSEIHRNVFSSAADMNTDLEAIIG